MSSQDILKAVTVGMVNDLGRVHATAADDLASAGVVRDAWQCRPTDETRGKAMAACALKLKTYPTETALYIYLLFFLQNKRAGVALVE